MQNNKKSYLSDHHNLKVYQKAIELVDSIRVLKNRLPFNEQQRVWKLVTAIPTRIAYGNSQLYVNQDVFSMKMALNSARKTNEWLIHALNEGIIDQKTFHMFNEEIKEVCKMTSGMMKKLQ